MLLNGFGKISSPNKLRYLIDIYTLDSLARLPIQLESVIC